MTESTTTRTATDTGAHSPAGTGPETAEALIAERRERIDELDTRIIALVRERMDVSGQIQAARIGSGGRRVHLARELDVLRTYGTALGKPGTAVAMKLLELCRGGLTHEPAQRPAEERGRPRSR
ncbi:chorismate mutase [Actinacidiphila acidipaludis]|uniref:Chorismate mutase n=1 Tax=Actinacidiphila acidipaludis TaxID=2873382 RepID=A0ABS7QB41_9ACTN|nr:chorismate mutase [Streptomyces acidipaludis]MBY8880400.1 chorismate mutase [Streptomyces acidipaludis]